MKNKTKKILLHLSANLGISTNYLENIVNAGSTMIFQKGFGNLEERFNKMNVPDDLLSEMVLCCAYGEVLRRLAEASK